jgi:hypothetical protein
MNEYLMEQHTEGFCDCGADWEAEIECTCGFYVQDLKRQYNRAIERVKKYGKLDKATRIKHQEEFNKLLKRMDELIIEIGFDKASQKEWMEGFENV